MYCPVRVFPVIAAAFLYLAGCSANTTTATRDGSMCVAARAVDEVAAPAPGGRAIDQPLDLSEAVRVPLQCQDGDSLSPPGPAQILSESELGTINLHRPGRLLLVDVEIPTQGVFPFFLDTGARRTYVDKTLAQKLSGDGEAGRTIHIPEVRLGNLAIERLEAPIFDHGPLRRLTDNDAYGTVGFAHFRDLPMRISLAESTITVGVDPAEITGCTGCVGAVPFVVHRDLHLPMVEGTVDGHPVPLLIDTGASGGIKIPEAIFDLLADESGRSLESNRFYWYTGESFTARRMERPVELQLGTLEMSVHPTHEVPLEIGLLGLEFLQHFIITLDPAEGIAYFEVVQAPDCAW